MRAGKGLALGIVGVAEVGAREPQTFRRRLLDPYLTGYVFVCNLLKRDSRRGGVNAGGGVDAGGGVNAAAA